MTRDVDATGLTTREARDRLARCGPNTWRPGAATGPSRATPRRPEGARGADASDRGELGADDGVVVDTMRSGTGNFGFDAACNTYVDLVDAGIIEPTREVAAPEL